MLRDFLLRFLHNLLRLGGNLLNCRFFVRF